MTVEQYAEARKGNIKDRTLKVQRSQLGSIFRRMGIEGREPIPDDVRKWLIEVKGSDMKHTTVAQYCSLLKQYWKTLGLEGEVEIRNIFETMKPSVSLSDYDRGYMTKEEIRALLDVADYPFDLMFALGYVYARRVGEVRRLGSEDIGYDSIAFHILKKEGTRREVFPLNMMTKKWIEKLFKRADESSGRIKVDEDVVRNPLFPYSEMQVYLRVQNAAKHAHILSDRIEEPIDKKAWNCHSLRHSRVRHLLDEGIEPRTIKDQLTFHERLSTLTDVYGVQPRRVGAIPRAPI